MALDKIDIQTLDPAVTIVVATGNAHKLVEIEAILGAAMPGVRFVSIKQLGDFEDPEETGATFAENALIKARAAVAETGFAAVADDSGLVVDALNGEPGVYSARYAGVNSKRQMVIIMVIGAMLGGLAGTIECIGLRHRLYMEYVTNVGYESVAVALVAGGNPIGVLVSALFFSILKAGGATMAIETGVSSSMSSIIIALCVLFVVGVGVADEKSASARKRKAKAAAAAKKEVAE